MVIRPWLAPFIVAFWCLTTGWLVTAKILPFLTPGSPPGYQALYASGSKPLPVAWTVTWNDQPLGWAMSQAHRTTDGRMTVESRMRLERIPIDEVLPPWAHGFLRRLVEQPTPDAASSAEQVAAEQMGDERVAVAGESAPPTADFVRSLAFDARGILSIDAKGNLEAFNTTVQLPSLGEMVFLDGTVEEGQVNITIRSRGMRYERSVPLPKAIMLGDEFSPQSTMPGLEPGKRWTVPTFSPLRIGASTLELLHARVIGEESLFWEDHFVRTHLVEYRSDPASHHRPRSRLWVDHAGRVLRQESQLFGSTLAFLRRSDEAASTLAEKLDDHGAAP